MIHHHYPGSPGLCGVERRLLKVRRISLRRLLVSKNLHRCLSLSLSACLSRNAVSYKQSPQAFCLCLSYFFFFQQNHSSSPLTTHTRSAACELTALWFWLRLGVRGVTGSWASGSISAALEFPLAHDPGTTFRLSVDGVKALGTGDPLTRLRHAHLS